MCETSNDCALETNINTDIHTETHFNEIFDPEFDLDDIHFQRSRSLPTILMDTEEDDMDTESTMEKSNQTRTGTPNKG